MIRAESVAIVSASRLIDACARHVNDVGVKHIFIAGALAILSHLITFNRLITFN